MKKVLALSFVMLAFCSCSVIKKAEISQSGEITSIAVYKDTAITTSNKKNVIKEESRCNEKNSQRGAGVLLNVPFYDQNEYPTGCELVSASMLLAYYGFYTTPAELIDDGHIEISSIYILDDKKYGSDPNKAFIGSPYDENSYGCYSGAIKSCFESYLPYEYAVSDLSGMSLDDICREYIDNDIPVLIWASMYMRETYLNDSSSWIVNDTGEHFQWISNEHCLVLVGYDESFYYFNDPLNDKNTAYERVLAEKRYEELGKQALTVINNK